MHHCSFRAFSCNPFSSFVLMLLFLDSVCMCACLNVSACLCEYECVCMCGTRLLRFKDHITYNNCAAGDINYTFSLFIVSSHHLLESVCKVRWNEPGLCCTTLYLRDLFSLQLSLSHHALKSRWFHYVYLRCFGNIQLLLSKHDSSSIDVWCSTTQCFWLLELLTDYSLCWPEIMRDGDTKYSQN